MYCRNCGKELPMDDVKFCPNCGASQNDSTLSFITFLISFYQKHNKIIVVYILWLFVHLYLYIIGGKHAGCENDFYPFVSSWNSNYGIGYYDFSELFIYVVVFPFVVYLIVKFAKSIKQYIKK